MRTHVSTILGKLHLASRTQAALYALREGRGPRGEDNQLSPSVAPPGATIRVIYIIWTIHRLESVLLLPPNSIEAPTKPGLKACIPKRARFEVSPTRNRIFI